MLAALAPRVLALPADSTAEVRLGLDAATKAREEGLPISG
jgi:hypothetical protein